LEAGPGRRPFQINFTLGEKDMARVTANDDLLGDSEAEHYGAMGDRTHTNRTLMQQERERAQKAEKGKKELEIENRNRAAVGLSPINTESPFGRGSDVDRLAQQSTMDEEEIRKKMRAFEREIRGRR
jgi:hypothetical protein